MERSLFGRQYEHIKIECPVFITSLPRAGTTLLLEIFSRIPGFATHRYRDMPFVLAPLLWQRISGHFRKRAELRERAHGDGMQVGYDSPEAFEEVIWRTFWPQKYRDDGIQTWSADETNTEFSDFLTEHMQKIIALRAQEDQDSHRYVSKNNANTARIGLLRRLYPDAVILVPFRNPVDHAASMQRQHENFLSRHADDPFSRKYMEDIGHFEFGQLHRPIRFETGGRSRRAAAGSPDTLDYWLAYWIDAFEHIAAHREQVLLLSFERACGDGPATLESLARRVAPEFADPPGDIAGMFREAPRYNMESRVQDGSLLDAAGALHRRLLDMSIV